MPGLYMPVAASAASGLLRPQTDAYDTKLKPEEEVQFQSWARANPRLGATKDYDARGFWKQSGGTVTDASGKHGTDYWKKPNHPTFSTESKYHGVDGNEGGTWAGSDKDGWSFKPGATNLKSRPVSELKQYWQNVEAPHGNKLLLPGDE